MLVVKKKKKTRIYRETVPSKNSVRLKIIHSSNQLLNITSQGIRKRIINKIQDQQKEGNKKGQNRNKIETKNTIKRSVELRAGFLKDKIDKSLVRFILKGLLQTKSGITKAILYLMPLKYKGS